MNGRLHHVELWVPDLGHVIAECGPDHYAAYLASTDGDEVALVAGDQRDG